MLLSRESLYRHDAAEALRRHSPGTHAPPVRGSRHRHHPLHEPPGQGGGPEARHGGCKRGDGEIDEGEGGGPEATVYVRKRE